PVVDDDDLEVVDGAVPEHVADGVDEVVALVERRDDDADGGEGGAHRSRRRIDRAFSRISAARRSGTSRIAAARSGGRATKASTFSTPASRSRSARTAPTSGISSMGASRPRST